MATYALGPVDVFSDSLVFEELLLFAEIHLTSAQAVEVLPFRRNSRIVANPVFHAARPRISDCPAQGSSFLCEQALRQATHNMPRGWRNNKRNLFFFVLNEDAFWL